MKNKGFTIVELMVSMVVVLLIVAGTITAMNYQSRSATYGTKAAHVQQAVEMSLALIRNDLMQAGGPSGVWWDGSNRLFVKYNGFLNFEAPVDPLQNCYQVRSVFCPQPPDCSSKQCNVAWQIVDNDGSFTMDRFPSFIGCDLPGFGSAFFGALNLAASDCRTLIGASMLTSISIVEATNPNDYVRTIRFVPSASFSAGSFASPAIVYELNSGRLLRNGVEILGGDVLVTSFTNTDHAKYFTVSLGYTWTPPFSFLFPKVSATQEISVGMLEASYLRVGG